MTGTQKIVMALPLILVLAGIVLWLAFRKTLRTRMRMNKQLRDDPDIHDYLVIFDWSRKVLYIPMVVMSLVAFALMLLQEHEMWDGPAKGMLGGIWMCVFFINFLVDEYEISIKVLIIVVLCVLALFLWLHILAWVDRFLDFFGHIAIEIDSTGYLLMALIFTVAIVVSWIRGLFYYVAITPNYMNIQVGPTETGEQISREDYSTRIDTGDFLERIVGFGRIIITFREQRRQPVVLLVGRIGKVAKKLESIRGKLAVDRY